MPHCDPQVFVANPNKHQPIVDILRNNKEKLLKYLEDFHTDRGKHIHTHTHTHTPRYSGHYEGRFARLQSPCVGGSYTHTHVFTYAHTPRYSGHH